jgi:hypothetical protein
MYTEKREREAMDLAAGPVLGFRGSENGKWHTCALVVTADDAAPELWWSARQDGQDAPEEVAAERVHLKSLKDFGIWRFDWSVEQTDGEQAIDYALAEDTKYTYSVPARGNPPRIAYASCAGFSSLKEVKRLQDKNAMWDVLADHHDKEPFHLMISGGDQVYADSVWDVVRPLSGWLERLFNVFDDWAQAEFTDEMRATVEEFYFCLYCQRWSQPEPAKVLSQVPSLMMWDDHDCFDGWGSYPPEQQQSAIFRGIQRTSANYVFDLTCRDAFEVHLHQRQNERLLVPLVAGEELGGEATLPVLRHEQVQRPHPCPCVHSSPVGSAGLGS